jgi:hypothetical protein
VNGSQLLENSFSLLDPIENDHFHGTTATTKQNSEQQSYSKIISITYLRPKPS